MQFAAYIMMTANAASIAAIATAKAAKIAAAIAAAISHQQTVDAAEAKLIAQGEMPA
jgi:hypothetical protein